MCVNAPEAALLRGVTWVHRDCSSPRCADRRYLDQIAGEMHQAQAVVARGSANRAVHVQPSDPGNNVAPALEKSPVQSGDSRFDLAIGEDGDFLAVARRRSPVT